MVFLCFLSFKEVTSTSTGSFFINYDFKTPVPKGSANTRVTDGFGIAQGSHGSGTTVVPSGLRILQDVRLDPESGWFFFISIHQKKTASVLEFGSKQHGRKQAKTGIWKPKNNLAVFAELIINDPNNMKNFSGPDIKKAQLKPRPVQSKHLMVRGISWRQRNHSDGVHVLRHVLIHQDGHHSAVSLESKQNRKKGRDWSIHLDPSSI